MGPQVALLVAALAGCLLPAGGCVICDQRVVAALDALEKEYLPTHMARERQGQVMETIRQTVRNFWDLPYLEDAFMGVIDEATMETSVLGFLRSMTLITNSDIADDTFVKEFSWMLTLEKAAFQRNVARFQREDFCPNKCVSSIQDVCNLDPAPSGMMLQPLIWCSNCKKQLHVCRKSTDCGVLPQRIIEETPTSNFETEEQLSPTLQPSEYPKPEKVLRSLLVGLLIWGFVVLMIGFVTAVLCFLPGNVMDSVKSWLLTNKVAALQSQVPKVPKENDAAPSHK
ncbi:izumo sperm-egg fusion protein 1-like isoform X4 [Panthera uncia]|uniref:izumo sperm-egg fusion protein 1-like isoform X4 n=1 Tax=Panthera uncia TaxID=29064 RepID=UPI0020FFCE2A|nr:izumo sperm-egg fusion protein 1-like isoform X4 [Panthera uncia]